MNQKDTGYPVLAVDLLPALVVLHRRAYGDLSLLVCPCQDGVPSPIVYKAHALDIRTHRANIRIVP